MPGCLGKWTHAKRCHFNSLSLTFMGRSRPEELVCRHTPRSAEPSRRRHLMLYLFVWPLCLVLPH